MIDTERHENKVRPKRLIIMSGDVVPETENIDLRYSDLLALSLPTMVILDKKNIKNKILEDYFPHENCYKDTEEFAAAHGAWLKKCDSLCQKKIDINRAFSSNGFWFLHRLSDLRYIHSILDRISEQYESIEVITPVEVEALQTATVNFSTLSFPIFGSGIGHVLKFIKAGLPDLTIHCYNSNSKTTLTIFGGPVGFFIKRLPEIIVRHSMKSFSAVIALFRPKNAMYWVVQGGYDVDVLRNNWKDKKFNYIWQGEIKSANKSSVTIDKELVNEIMNETELFINSCLPRYEEWLSLLIQSYVESIVLRLPAVEDSLLERMKFEEPKGILYAIGIENILEETIGRVANKLSIPVYTFKHGGIENQFLMPSILDEYLEKNPAIKRIQFLHNEYEKSNFENIENVHPIVTGALVIQKKYNLKKNNAKILFSAGVPAHYNFKEMRKMCSDYERYVFSRDLVTICANIQSSLDIKIHPVEWNVGYDFFLNLIKENECFHAVNVIVGGAIERMLSNYSLLVLDMVSTRVFSQALYLGIPIVLYIPNNFPMCEKHIEALKKRVHVVNNYDDLLDVLVKHKNSELDNRCNADFQNKYLTLKSSDEGLDLVKSSIA